MPPTVGIESTFGALLIGVVVSAMLYGVTCIQAFYYFQNYTSDPLLIKLLVILLLVLGGLHSTLATYTVYHYTIVNYANPSALLRVTWSIAAEPAQLAVAILAIHIFYARRVYYVSRKNIPLVTVISILISAHFGILIFSTVKTIQFGDFAHAAQFVSYLYISVSIAVTTDTLIAVSLSYYLHKSRSGMAKTDSMINRLIVLAIHNGLLPCVVDILTLTMMITRPQSFAYLALSQVFSDLYSNGVLATLNARRSISRIGEGATLSFRIPASTFSDETDDETKMAKSDLADIEVGRPRPSPGNENEVSSQWQ